MNIFKYFLETLFKMFIKKLETKDEVNFANPRRDRSSFLSARSCPRFVLAVH